VVTSTRGRLLFAAVVIVVLAGIYAVAGLRHPAPAAGYTTGTAGHATVTSAISACVAPGSAGVVAGSLATAAVPGSAASGEPVAGEAVVTRLVAGGSASPGPIAATLTGPDTLKVTDVKTAPVLPKALQASQPGSSPRVSTQAARGGVEVTASGAMAQGLAVEQTGRGGYSSAQCGTPSTSLWFVGPGQASEANIEVYLMNTDGQAADVQVTAVTDVTRGGPVLGSADNGITVPPHSMVVQSLGGLLQSSKIIALHVSTSVGRVVAAIREGRSGSQAGGWLPQAEAPARVQVIPGIPAARGARDLYVAVPGDAPADVKVTAVTARGSYQPTGGTGIELLEGSANEIPLSSLSGVPSAIKISSSVPVVVGMLVPGGPPGISGAVAASAGPVDEQGVLAASPVGPAGSTELVLSAAGQAAAVHVTVAASGVPITGQSPALIQIRAGYTVVWPVKAPRAPRGHRISQVMIVVTPVAGSGPVYAARVISSGGVVQSIMPVPSSLTWVLEPAVHSSLSGILP
jgi:uncharacterized protein DUF5719